MVRFAASVPQVGKFDPVTREPLVEGQVRLNLGLRAATQEYLVSSPPPPSPARLQTPLPSRSVMSLPCMASTWTLHWCSL